MFILLLKSFQHSHEELLHNAPSSSDMLYPFLNASFSVTINHFSKGPWFLLLRVLKNKDVDTKYIHIYWDTAASRASLGQWSHEIYVYINSHIITSVFLHVSILNTTEFIMIPDSNPAPQIHFNFSLLEKPGSHYLY